MVAVITGLLARPLISYGQALSYPGDASASRCERSSGPG
jgi:hypothetical protein